MNEFSNQDNTSDGKPSGGGVLIKYICLELSQILVWKTGVDLRHSTMYWEIRPATS